MMSKVGSKTGGSSAAGGINEMPDLDAPTQGDRSSKKTSKKKNDVALNFLQKEK